MAKGYVGQLLGKNETILLAAHQHWLILAGSIITEIVFILVVIAAVVAASIFFPVFTLLFIAVGVLLILIPVIAMARDILAWRNREYLITNLRVIQLNGIFNKSVTDSSLDKVNDVKMEQSALGRMFDFGDIEILTASELGVNLFRRIEDPIRFKTTMLNAKERLEHEGFRQAEQVDGFQPANIPALIAQLDQLRQKGVLTDEEFQKKKAELLAKM